MINLYRNQVLSKKVLNSNFKLESILEVKVVLFEHIQTRQNKFYTFRTNFDSSATKHSKRY